MWSAQWNAMKYSDQTNLMISRNCWNIENRNNLHWWKYVSWAELFESKANVFVQFVCITTMLFSGKRDAIVQMLFKITEHFSTIHSWIQIVNTIVDVWNLNENKVLARLFRLQLMNCWTIETVASFHCAYIAKDFE